MSQIPSPYSQIEGDITGSPGRSTKNVVKGFYAVITSRIKKIPEDAYVYDYGWMQVVNEGQQFWPYQQLWYPDITYLTEDKLGENGKELSYNLDRSITQGGGGSAQDATIFRPAHELNDTPTPVGSVVWMWPSGGIPNTKDDQVCNDNQLMLFAFSNLGPYEVEFTEDSVPEYKEPGSPGSTTLEQKHRYTAKAFFLSDQAATEITVYPPATLVESQAQHDFEHEQKENTNRPYLREVIRKADGSSTTQDKAPKFGTRGWVQWDPRAYQNSKQDGAYYGQWCLVACDASTIFMAKVKDIGATGPTGSAELSYLKPGTVGDCNLYWGSKGPSFIDSKFVIPVNNQTTRKYVQPPKGGASGPTGPGEVELFSIYYDRQLNKYYTFDIQTSDNTPWYNSETVSPSTCPKWGIAGINGVHGTEPDKIVQGCKPTGTYRREYIVNTGSEVETLKEGTYQNHPILKCLYDDTDDTPTLGQLWAPTEDKWYLTKAKSATSAISQWAVVVSGPIDTTNKVLMGYQIKRDEIYRFELKTALTPGGVATAYLCSYTIAQGWVWARNKDNIRITMTVSDAIGMYRGRAIVESPSYIPGSLGYCRWDCDNIPGQFEIIAMQPMAMLISAAVNQSSGVKPDDATFSVDYPTANYGILQPIGGVLDSMPTTAHNPLGLTLADDANVLLAWDEIGDNYFAIAGGTENEGIGIKWAEVQSGFTNDTGDAPRSVSVKKCGYAGGGAGAAFTVKTTIRPVKDTSLFEDDVVGYQIEADGDKVIVTDCWDDPIGTVRLATTMAAVRASNGWEELAATQDQFVRGWDGNQAGLTGGSNTHSSSDIAGLLDDHTITTANATCASHTITACVNATTPGCFAIPAPAHAAHNHTATAAHAGRQDGGADTTIPNLPEYCTFIILERTS